MFRKGEAARIDVDFGCSFKGAAKKPGISKPVNGKSAAKAKELPETSVDGRLRMAFKAPSEPGAYNLSLDAEGVNDREEKAARSVNYNFAVADDIRIEIRIQIGTAVRRIRRTAAF